MRQQWRSQLSAFSYGEGANEPTEKKITICIYMRERAPQKHNLFRSQNTYKLHPLFLSIFSWSFRYFVGSGVMSQKHLGAQSLRGERSDQARGSVATERVWGRELFHFST